MSQVYDALRKIEQEVMARGPKLSNEELGFKSRLLKPESQDSLGAVSRDPLALGASIVCATEGLVESAKDSILGIVRGLAQQIEDGVGGYLSESQRRMNEFQETGFGQLKALITEELARHREIYLAQLREQTSNMLRGAIAQLRAEAEGTTQVSRDAVSKQSEEATATLSEHLTRFRTSAKVDSQEGLDSFRKQMDLMASEAVDQSRQAVSSTLEDLRARMIQTANILKNSQV
jgi:hypothetical protein